MFGVLEAVFGFTYRGNLMPLVVKLRSWRWTFSSSVTHDHAPGTASTDTARAGNSQTLPRPGPLAVLDALPSRNVLIDLWRPLQRTAQQQYTPRAHCRLQCRELVMKLGKGNDSGVAGQLRSTETWAAQATCRLSSFCKYHFENCQQVQV